MHHGTLMFDSDLTMVQKALMVPAAKYESKGFKSVRSRVTNLREYAKPGMTLEDFIRTLREYMTEGTPVEVYHLTEEDVKAITKIKETRYDTWEWNYGASPQYSVHKASRVEGCGQIEIYMNVEEGRIREIQSYGDFFGDGITGDLKMRLMDCPLYEEALVEALEGFDISGYFAGLDINTLILVLLG